MGLCVAAAGLTERCHSCRPAGERIDRSNQFAHLLSQPGSSSPFSWHIATPLPQLPDLLSYRLRAAIR